MIGPLSKSETRRQLVADVADVIERVAVDAGWQLNRRESFSGGTSIYLRLKIKSGITVVVRISDHSPSRPFGLRGDKPTLIVIPGLVGCVSSTCRWLTRTAEDVHRVVADGRHRVTLPAA